MSDEKNEMAYFNCEQLIKKLSSDLRWMRELERQLWEPHAHGERRAQRVEGSPCTRGSGHRTRHLHRRVQQRLPLGAREVQRRAVRSHL